MNLEFSQIGFAFILTLLAGLSTGLGAAIAFFIKRENTSFLTFSLGFSAGVMVYISFVELYGVARENFAAEFGETGGWWAIAAFFAGMALAALIDKFIPEDENPHEFQISAQISENSPAGNFSSSNVKRSGMLFALAIAIHNFPEGIATLASALNSTTLGFSIALAIAIHNVPEGMAVAIPLFYGTGSRKKAFWYATLSGLTEPIGAGVAILILLPFLSQILLAILFALVAGIMIYIAFDELLPMAEKWGKHHLSIYGVIAGMLLMAILLV